MQWRVRLRSALTMMSSVSSLQYMLTTTLSCGLGKIQHSIEDYIQLKLLYRKCLCHSDTFSSGISNGAEWYLVDSGMQDFNYLFTNCMEITAELSCWKRPPESQLDTEWSNNVESMLSLLETVHTGVMGQIFDEECRPLAGASVMVEDRDKTVISSSRGEYWRLLLPGSYIIRAQHQNSFGVISSDSEKYELNT